MTEEEMDLYAWKMLFKLNEWRCNCNTTTAWHGTLCSYRKWKGSLGVNMYPDESLKDEEG